MSSPSSAMMAMRVPTWRFLLPSGAWTKEGTEVSLGTEGGTELMRKGEKRKLTMIFPMIPSSVVSTSIVALSVSWRGRRAIEKAKKG